MSAFSFNYPDSPYYVPNSIFTDISCVKVNTPPGTIVFTISPSLPAPLTINSANGEITGLPTFLSISPTTTYTVDASYTIFPYNTITTLQLGINFLPEFFYVGSPYVKQIGISVNAVSPPIAPTYSIPILPGMFYTDVSPSLLSAIGLVLNTSTGEITGIPTSLISNQTYIIQANNAGVTYNASLVLSIENAPQPPDYPQSIYNLTQGVPVVIAPQTVQTNTTYAISGCGLPQVEPTSYIIGLPIGLAFD